MSGGEKKSEIVRSAKEFQLAKTVPNRASAKIRVKQLTQLIIVHTSYSTSSPNGEKPGGLCGQK